MSYRTNPYPGYYGDYLERNGTTSGQGVPPQVAQAIHVLQPNYYSYPAAAGRPSPYPAPQRQTNIPAASSPMNENLLERLMSAIGPILATHQQATITRMEQLETSIQSLSNEVASMRKEAQTQTKYVAQYLEKSHSVQHAATKTLTDRVGRLEKIIGTSYDRDESKSILGQLDIVSFAVEELLERAKDPHASLPDIIHDVGTTPVRQTESPKREFSNFGVNPRTPEPSSTSLRHFSSVAVETSLDEISFFARPNGSSGKSAADPSAVLDAMNEDNQSGFEQIQSNPNETSALSQTMRDNDFLCTASLPDMQALHQDTHMRRGVAQIQSRFPSVPPVSDSLIPVDWTREDAPSSAASNGHGQKTVAYFQLDPSPQATEPYSLLQNPRDMSPDGTASLRRSALSDSPTGSPDHTSQSPISQFHSCPSVSPMPSPPPSTSPAPAPAPSPTFSIDGPSYNSADTSHNANTTIHTISTTSDSSASTFPHDIEDGLTPPDVSAYSDSVVQEEALVARLIAHPVSSLAGSPSPICPRTPLPPSPTSMSALSTPPTPSTPEVVLMSSASHSLSPLSSISDEDRSKDAMEDVNLNLQLQTKAEPQRTTDLKLKITARTEQSIAVTRVKKRKIKKQGTLLPEPPLKRARQKMNRNGSGVNKRKLAPAAPQPEWPQKLEGDGDDGFLRKFVQCDGCLFWYHYGCVAIVPGDVRLEDSEIFTCPPCFADAERLCHKSGRGQEDICSRPDCNRNSATDEFFVSAIVGRITKVEGGRGKRYLWLVKWDGYPITEATWEDESSMSDPQKLIQAFYEAVEKEGLERDDHSTIFVREALDGGWHDPND